MYFCFVGSISRNWKLQDFEILRNDESGKVLKQHGVENFKFNSDFYLIYKYFIFKRNVYWFSPCLQIVQFGHFLWTLTRLLHKLLLQSLLVDFRIAFWLIISHKISRFIFLHDSMKLTLWRLSPNSYKCCSKNQVPPRNYPNDSSERSDNSHGLKLIN